MLLSHRLTYCLDTLWNCFLADGIQPAQALEQITYLLTLKQLEEEICELALVVSPSPPLLWSQLRVLPDDVCRRLLCEEVLPWLRGLASDGMHHLNTAFCTLSTGRVLKSVMVLIDDLFAPSQRQIHAHVYEALLHRAEMEATHYAGRGEAFYTPKHLALLLANLVQPQAGESICDISCGSGRLIAGAHTYLLQSLSNPDELEFDADGCPLTLDPLLLSPEQQMEISQTHYLACDISREATLQTWMLLRCLNIRSASVLTMDALGESFNRRMLANGGEIGNFDIIIGNPPYGARLLAEELLGGSLQWLKTAKLEVLFVELALQLLKPGGRAGLIVPDGLLFNTSKVYRMLRHRLLEETQVQAVVSLPSCAFLPHAGVKTSILLFQKGSRTESPVWCYAMQADGRSLDRKRQMLPEQSDIPDLLVKYHARFAQPPGAWLRETQALLTRRHVAYLQDADIQLQWENIPPELSAYCYAFPWYEYEQRCDCDGEVQEIAVYRRSLARMIDDCRDWEVLREDLAEGDILLSSRYKPEVSLGGRYSVHAPRSSSRLAA